MVGRYYKQLSALLAGILFASASGIMLAETIVSFNFTFLDKIMLSIAICMIAFSFLGYAMKRPKYGAPRKLE